MPTAARLVAAVLLGIMGLIISDMIKTTMPDHTQFGYFSYVNIILGALCGWFVVGSRVGQGMVTAFSNGLTGMAALVFWGLFAQASNEMLRLAFLRRYDGPFEALVSIFQIMADFGANLVHTPIIGALLAGGIAVGVAAEWVSNRWS